MLYAGQAEGLWPAEMGAQAFQSPTENPKESLHWNWAVNKEL